MWLPFIPLLAAGVLLKVYQALFDPNGADVGLAHGGAITIGFAAIVVAAFVIIGIISYTDKKTSALYEIKRNPLAGIFAIASGALMFADSANTFISGMNVVNIIDALMTVVGAVAFILMGISSFSGNNRTKSAAGLMLMPVIWGVVRTFLTFVSDTTVASESRDMMDIVFMVLGTFFLFNCGMVYVNVSGKNAVKGCFLYGMPFILVSFAYTISHTIYQLRIGGFDFMENIRTFEFFAIALYALFLLIELTQNAAQRSKEEYESAGIELKPEREKEEIVIDEAFEGEFSLVDDQLMKQAEQTMESVKDDGDKIQEIRELKATLEDEGHRFDDNEESVDDALSFNEGLSLELESGDQIENNSDIEQEYEPDRTEPENYEISEQEAETAVSKDTLENTTEDTAQSAESAPGIMAEDAAQAEAVKDESKKDEENNLTPESILDNYDISSIDMEGIDRLIKELTEEENG